MGVSFGIADWLRVRRIARRSATDWSFGSGSSFDWTSMTNAELTAENRPAYEEESDDLQERAVGDAQKST